MEPITVTICAGTACTVMDDTHLLLLDEALPEALKGRVQVRGTRCLDHCQTPGSALEAPYVQIGEEVMARATVAKVVARLEELLA
jgi:NADH:ubiquinone oxidoreductase subunit E